MKTTLVIDDELYRQVKARAALDGRTVTELVEAGLRAVLTPQQRQPEHEVGSRRVRLPLITSRADARALFVDMTSEEIHQRLARLQAEDDLTHAGTSA